MRVLVTGGAGFIGSHIATALISKGHEVTVLDDLSSGKKENIDHLISRQKFHFYEGSILNLTTVLEIIKNREIERISHQAAVAAWPEASRTRFRPMMSM